MATLYTLQTAGGVLHAELTLDEAASLLGVDRLELEWAIEEASRAAPAEIRI